MINHGNRSWLLPIVINHEEEAWRCVLLMGLGDESWTCDLGLEIDDDLFVLFLLLNFVGVAIWSLDARS